MIHWDNKWDKKKGGHASMSSTKSSWEKSKKDQDKVLEGPGQCWYFLAQLLGMASSQQQCQKCLLAVLSAVTTNEGAMYPS